MYSLLRPGDGPGRINAIIFVLFLFYLWAKFFIPEESPVVETLSQQAEVVSVPQDASDNNYKSSFQQVKLRLPDGMHAFVAWNNELPRHGETVRVLVKIHEDGSRRVSVAR